MNTLIIVESPAKARKIKGFFKDKPILVKSSFGHIYDLDKKTLSIDIENNFKPNYKVLPDKKKIAKELKNTNFSNVLLAADDDREGEAIAWHCGRLLKLSFTDTNRIKFNEITKEALSISIQNPIHLDLNQVNAQQARRVIDRLVGYKLSPLLWRHIQSNKKGLSAGRVQSCLLHMLQCHEKKINEFIPDKSYLLKGFMDRKLKLAVDFVFKNKNISTEEIYELLNTFIINENNYDDKLFVIKNSRQSKEKTYSPPPFITSTLQQQAQKDHGFKVSNTMSMAQKLYEDGHITYMRTDSTYINGDFEKQLKLLITDKYSIKHYMQKQKKKVKGAQEAHEAIRPTKLNMKLPDNYNDNEIKLYNLIVKRTIQAYMSPAIYNVLIIQFTNKYSEKYGHFQSKQKEIEFKGFLEYTGLKLESTIQSDILIQDKFELVEALSEYISSKPPQYYNESMIVKQLESNGIGRPSTYSNIINTIYSRNYTEIKTIPNKQETINCIEYKGNQVNTTKKIINIPPQKSKIVLTPLGKQVLQYLETYFSDIINCQFTALVESDLDRISTGDLIWTDVVKKVYGMFSVIVDRQLKISSNTKNIEIMNTINYKNDEILIINGQYSYYFSYKRKNYNVSNYLKWKSKKVSELNAQDIKTILMYPLKLEKYNNKDIIIYIGPYGYYLKYNNKNYRIHQNPPHTFEYCSSILNN